MLKTKLIKLIFFERKEVRLLYISATGFRSHTSPTIFVPVLCLLCLYYAYYVSTMPVLCLLCLYYAYYAYLETHVIKLILRKYNFENVDLRKKQGIHRDFI